MKKQLSYSDLLKDPRWQKKRLQILQRDNFKCRSCDDDSKTLHVHHTLYDTELLPWEYANDDLITLCETCHDATHYLLKHDTIGFETFSLVMKLFDSIESESIEKYLSEHPAEEPTGEISWE